MRYIIIYVQAILFIQANYGQVGIGTQLPNASAQLDVTSSNKGFLPPRMTSAERNAIANPSPGLMIFNTTTQSLQIFTSYGWFGIQREIPERKLLGGEDVEEVYSLKQTSDGGFIIAGTTQTNLNGDVTNNSHGQSDFWIVKLDASRNIVWNKTFGGNRLEKSSSILQTSDGGFIVAGYSASSSNGTVTGTTNGGNDYWIIKLDGLGRILWDKLIGGAGDDKAQSIVQTSDGGYIIGGFSNSTTSGDITSINHGFYDAWILKLDEAGRIVWNKLIGGSGTDEISNIQQTTDGKYILTGYSTSTDGDITDINNGSSDYWVIKLDGDGTIEWNKLFGGNGSEKSFCIQETVDEGFIIAGSSNSSANGDVTATNHFASLITLDYWIVKLDHLGRIVWNKLVGGLSDDIPQSVQITSDGGYIVAGYSQSSASGNITAINHGYNDYLIVKFDGLGNILWKKLLGGSNHDFAYSIEPSSDGGFIVAGFSYSSANGDVTGLNHGFSDIWIIKLESDGFLY